MNSSPSPALTSEKNATLDTTGLALSPEAGVRILLPMIEEYVQSDKGACFLQFLENGKPFLEASPEEKLALCVYLVRLARNQIRLGHATIAPSPEAEVCALLTGRLAPDMKLPYGSPMYARCANVRSVVVEALAHLAKEKVRLNLTQIQDVVDSIKSADGALYPNVKMELLDAHLKACGPSPGVLEAVEILRTEQEKQSGAEPRKLAKRLQKFLAQYSTTTTAAPSGEEVSTAAPCISGEEPWADAALLELDAMAPALRGRWSALLAHAMEMPGGSQPTAAWKKKADALVQALGWAELRRAALAWFPLVDVALPASESWRRHVLDLKHTNVNVLRGMVWMCVQQEDTEMGRALANLSVSAFRKIPGNSFRAASLGNACIFSLGAMPGMTPLGHLSWLKVKLRSAVAQASVDKAFTAAAAARNVPRADVEEMMVPVCGLSEVGLATEDIAGYTSRLEIDENHDVQLRWFDANGKEYKSMPAAVKTGGGDDLKDLKQNVKDLERMLPAQKERLNSLYLEQKAWSLADWRERYLNHPLVGVVARRLIWVFEEAGQEGERSAVWFGGRLLDRTGTEITPGESGAACSVTLWHPIGRFIAEVTGWRARLEELAVRQPFKQAHREVYILTDAERGTRVYSNRFAAHVLRQHQFHALCANRGWKYRLRLRYDGEYPQPSRHIPRHGLTAEYWVEALGDYFDETNDVGTYLYVGTDQVRFYRTGPDGKTPEDKTRSVPLEEIPALVLSEILRDIDLFVGVASVGNDPNWNDGGPDGHFARYWADYSFGDLSATAHTRRDTLQRLIPRLAKLAPRCTFTDRFLVVRGDLRTYKIHFGSGNILMEPNDQYLCIVPKQTPREPGEQVLLPFEGDNLLSVILSKAFLLAGDSKIKDSSITSQITSG